MGFKRIVFLNGHYDNTYAIAYACASAGEQLPPGVRAYPVNYWDAITPDEAAEFFDPANGLHANKGETSAVMAINPALVDIDAANAEMPPFPEVSNPAAVHTAFFFSSPGSVYRATHSGTWGDARESSAEFGERYLDVVSALHDPPARRHRAHLPGHARPLDSCLPRWCRSKTRSTVFRSTIGALLEFPEWGRAARCSHTTLRTKSDRGSDISAPWAVSRPPHAAQRRSSDPGSEATAKAAFIGR